MIIIKEQVKDLPTLIFLMIFNFWAGTVCAVFESESWILGPISN